MKKTLKFLFIFVIALFSFYNLTYAKNKSENLFQYNEKLKIENSINGTAFLAGNEVKINNEINGVAFVAGEDIDVNAKQNYMFLFGINVDLDSDVENDVFVFGENVKINKNIKRDAYLAGTTIVVNGNINRNTYVYGTDVEIKGNIKGNLNINANNIIIDKNAKIEGTLKYNDNAIIEGLNDKINSKTYALKSNISFGQYVYTFITGYFSITIVALVLVYILEKIFKKALKEINNKKDFASLIGKGFIILLCVPIISITLLMTGLFSSLAIIILIIYGLLIYVSEIFTAYLLAMYIDKKYLKKNLNNYILIIFGLFILRILGIIPLIGGFITFISLLFGLGILSNMILKIKN